MDYRIQAQVSVENSSQSPIFFLFFLAAGILLNFIIPPFQNPDEPQHFRAIAVSALGEDKAGYVEKEIIKFMDANLWWKRLGIGQPAVLPDRLSNIGFLVDYNKNWSVESRLQKLDLYQVMAGKVLAFFTKKNIHAGYYLLRLLSILFILSSILIIGRIFSANSFPFVPLGLLFVLFLPQFLILSISVNPDAFSILISTLFFFAAFSLIRGLLKFRYFLLLFLTAGTGFLTDRSTFFLLILALLLPLFLLKIKNDKQSIVYGLGFVVVFLLLGFLLVQICPLQIENSFNLIKSSLNRGISSLPALFSFNEFNRTYWLLTADSFFFKFGWMAFGTSKLIYFIWRVILLFTFMGLILYAGKFVFSKLGKNQPGPTNSKSFKVLLFSFTAVAIQLAGLWFFYGTNNILVQGRHLYPLILPIALLFVTGIKSFFDLFHKKGGLFVLSSIVLLEFFFLSYALWAYVVPVFHLMVKGPHSGV